MEKALNILLAIMLVVVMGMLYWIKLTIEANAKAQTEVVMAREQAQYQSCKRELSELLTSNLQKIADDEHKILEQQAAAAAENVSRIEQKVDKNPKVIKTIEHKTDVISEDELKRREKVQQDWRDYREKLKEYRHQHHD